MAEILKFEHFAINVEDPVSVATWYCDNLGMRVVRHGDAPVHMHFLADTTGRVVIEIYNSPPELVPDYASQNPQVLHIAFATPDIDKSIEKLQEAGATLEGGPGTTPAGDQLAMLRDPWGFAVQLTQRAQPMI